MSRAENPLATLPPWHYSSDCLAVVIGIHEVPASRAMEMGKLMPEVTDS